MRRLEVLYVPHTSVALLELRGRYHVERLVWLLGGFGLLESSISILRCLQSVVRGWRNDVESGKWTITR
jgi:hypothetical protein